MNINISQFVHIDKIYLKKYIDKLYKILYMSEVEPEITNTIEADEPVNELPKIEEEPKAEPIAEQHKKYNLKNLLKTTQKLKRAMKRK